jgi:prepilin-type N-terminal cleavage/methylation domain-containing protein
VRPRRAMTLLEVLVTLVILAVVTSVATLAPRRIEHRRDAFSTMLDDSLSASIAQGRTITIATRVGDRTIAATLHPDGSIIADSEFYIGASRGQHER